MKSPGPHRAASYPSDIGPILPGFFHAAGGLRAAGPFDDRPTAITRELGSAAYDDGARGPVAAESRERRRRKARPSARNTTAPTPAPMAWPRMSREVA
jgi:hypothetical protein